MIGGSQIILDMGNTILKCPIILAGHFLEVNLLNGTYRLLIYIQFLYMLIQHGDITVVGKFIVSGIKFWPHPLFICYFRNLFPKILKDLVYKLEIALYSVFDLSEVRIMQM